MTDETPGVTTESTKKPAKSSAAQAKLETVVNCSKSGGHITDMEGNRVPVGDQCELPPEVCERLVLSGVARYPAKSDS